jgi:tRNA threonylcarbamoyladenosine biosynthesis protein TsaB
MIILTIKTDNPEAELALYSDAKKLAEIIWPAHRELTDTIHKKIDELLNSNNLTLKDINGIACFKGPGSFTGLRIGLTVGNALAYGLEIPIVSLGGEDWAKKSIERLVVGENEKIVLPEYGGKINITKPKK